MTATYIGDAVAETGMAIKYQSNSKKRQNQVLDKKILN